MVRVIGAIFILTGCFGLGFWYRQQILGRIKALRQLQDILEIFESEIRYSREPLPICCGRLAERVKEPCRSALGQVLERMTVNEGESFEKIFTEELLVPLRKMPLKEEDRDDFFRCIFKNGFADVQVQLRMMEQSREILIKRAELLTGEAAEKSRMAIGLGAMGGLMLLLILGG